MAGRHAASNRASMVTLTTEPIPSALHVETAGQVSEMFGRDAIYLVMSSLQVLTVFVITPVVTRLLAAGQFGVVATGTAVMQVLFVLAGVGLAQAVQREFASERGPEIARKLVTAGIGLAVLITAAVGASVPLWAHAFGSDVTTWAMLWSVLWAGSSAVTATCLALLRSRDQLLPFAAVSAMQTAVADVVALVLVETIGHTAQVWLFGQFVSQVAAALIGLVALRPLPVRRPDFAHVRRAIRFGAPLMGSAISVFVMNSSDRLVIEAIKGSYAVGRYQIAYSIGSIPTLVVGLLSVAWMPRFFGASATGERTLRLVEQSRDAVSGLLPAVVLGVGVGAPVLLHLWAPSSYRPGQLTPVTLIVLAAVVPTAFTAASARLLMADGRTAAIAVTNTAAAVLNVILNLALVPSLGIWGSAAATLIASAVLALLSFWRSRSVAHLRRPVVWPLALTAVVFAVACAAAYLRFTVATVSLRVAITLIAAVWLTDRVRRLRMVRGS